MAYLESGHLSEIEDGWDQEPVDLRRLRLALHAVHLRGHLLRAYGELSGQDENIDRSLIATLKRVGTLRIRRVLHNPNAAPYLPAAYPATEVPQGTPVERSTTVRPRNILLSPRHPRSPATLRLHQRHYRQARCGIG